MAGVAGERSTGCHSLSHRHGRRLMTLSDASIKNPVFAWMLMIGLIVFGWIGFHRMGISQLPDVDFPVVTVTVTWEDASPEIMETQVADIIEDSVTSVEGTRDMYS